MAARGSDGDSNIASHSFPEFRLSSNYSLTFSILILKVFQNFVFSLKIFLNIFNFAFHHFQEFIHQQYLCPFSNSSSHSFNQQ